MSFGAGDVERMWSGLGRSIGVAGRLENGKRLESQYAPNPIHHHASPIPTISTLHVKQASFQFKGSVAR